MRVVDEDLIQDSQVGFLERVGNLSKLDHNSRQDRILEYDTEKWRERAVKPQNTLQFFVTDVCNLRCLECFVSQRLGAQQMSFEEYELAVYSHLTQVQKVTLLGGEPTLHRRLPDMVKLNANLGLKTVIYTNGVNLSILEPLMEDESLADLVSIRIGVHGLTPSEHNPKPLMGLKPTNLPVTMVYMLAPYNYRELLEAAYCAEENFPNCRGFYISSIREIDRTGDFWLDTERTLSMPAYAQVVQAFLDSYQGNLSSIHMSTRGVLVTKIQNFEGVTRCRFASIMRDGSVILAPLDISLNNTSPKLTFNEQPCSRHHKCVLQKIVLERVERSK